MPKATVKVAKGAEVKAELKPKILRVEGQQPKISKLGEIGMSARPQHEGRLEFHLRPLKKVAIEPMKMPVFKPSEIPVKSVSQIAPKPPKLIEKEFLIEMVKKAAKSVTEELPEISEEEVYVPPFLEKLSLAAESMSMDKPVCIVLSKSASDSFIHSVALVCREIYRFVKGGKPEPRWISKGLRDEIERDLRAEGMVFVVDDSKCEFLPDFGKIHCCRELLKKVDIDVVLDRLREFFSQGFGFVIFYVNEKWSGQFAKMLEEKVGAFVNIIYISYHRWQPEVKACVARACWGFLECEDETFDEIFARSEKEFFKELMKARGDIELWQHIEEDRNAGDEHEGMKAIVVDCLAKESGATGKSDVVRMLKDGIIETEHRLDKLDNGERTDVYLPSIQRFVEIETFYGRGDPVIKLDKDTLSKYKKRSIHCVDIVLLTGVQALLYARRLIKLANICCKEWGLKVNFYLPNIREKKLVPLRDVFRELKNTVGPPKLVDELTGEDVKRLWSEFSHALRKRGMDPEKHKKLFTIMLDRSKSYQDNLSCMLEEIKLLEDEQREA
jgi:hypothetical protein